MSKRKEYSLPRSTPKYGVGNYASTEDTYRYVYDRVLPFARTNVLLIEVFFVHYSLRAK